VIFIPDYYDKVELIIPIRPVFIRPFSSPEMDYPISEADLRDLDLTSTDLGHARLYKAVLCGADLREANQSRRSYT
jgi:hypothetical protein